MKVSQITFSKINPRKFIDEKKQAELVESVKSHGVIEPIIVRVIGKDKYEVVCGERRLRAAIECKLEDINAVALHDFNDQQVREMQIIENLQRDDLNGIDEAEAFSTMLKKFKVKPSDLATKIGKSEAYITSRIKLIDLPEKVKEAIAKNEIMPGHGIVIARLESEKEQMDLFRRIKKDKMSVRAAENALDDYGRALNKAPFDKAQCVECSFNGSKQKELFDKETHIKGKCMNVDCFTLKMNAHINSSIAELKKQGMQVITAGKIRGQSYTDLNCSWREYKKDLGKHYKEKCLAKCPNHAYVISEISKYGEDKGIQKIEEYCLNSKCLNILSSKEKQKAISGAGQKDWQKEREQKKLSTLNLEALRRFWKAKLSHNAKDKMIEATFMYFAANALYGHNVDIGFDSIQKIYDLDKEKFTQAGISLFLALVDKAMDDDDLKYLTEVCGYTPKADFVIDEEYLKPRTKEQILKLAKELGVDLKKITADKKDELIKQVLQNVPKGKVPKELVK